MDKIYLAGIQSVPGIGHNRIKLLLDFFGSAQQVWMADRRDLFLSKILNETTLCEFLKIREHVDIDQLAENFYKNKINITTLYDNDYPKLLKSIYNPPYVLYYRGILPFDGECFSIVGARKATAYGKNAATLFASELAEAGMCIVSGGARGIDSYAHRGALDRGKTIAVLGNGVDVAYPSENSRLFSNIIEQGALVSEYLPGTLPHPGNFPARNRLISGMSKGVLIVEAAEKSGALITADFALEEGRDVFSIPGYIFSEMSKGTNNLIKQGAKLVSSSRDILEEYNVFVEKQMHCVDILNKEEKAVFSRLDFALPRSIEEIVTLSKIPLNKVAYVLLELELRGLVVSHNGQRYTRSVKEEIR